MMKRAPQPLARQTTRTSNSPSSQEPDCTHRARTFRGPSPGLCSFRGLNRDGAFPQARLIVDSARNLTELPPVAASPIAPPKLVAVSHSGEGAAPFSFLMP